MRENSFEKWKKNRKYEMSKMEVIFYDPFGNFFNNLINTYFLNNYLKPTSLI